MSSRIEVELTSQKPDGFWTWRAAGAKEPRGTLDGSILYEGAKIGDVVRAEVVFEIDGITVESVYAPKAKQQQSNLIELSSKEPVSYLTRTVSNRDRNRPGSERRSPGTQKRQRPERTGNETLPDRPNMRTEGRPSFKRTEAPRTSSTDSQEKRSRQKRPERLSQPAQTPKAPTPRFKKLMPRNTHRAKTLEGLAPEHLPIAEQLLKGGLPAVRQALATQNEKAIAEGKPTIPETTVLAIAEPMLPLLKLATWKDRAEVAIEIANEASLRDLRSVISAADLIRHDDSTREMLDKLKGLTEQRAAKLHSAWLAEIRENLSAKRIIRAARLSSRPPEPIAKLPADLLEELTHAANEMLSPETPADRWSTLLDALSQSPIRRQVQPRGLPANAPVELIEQAKESSGRIPALAQLLGIAIPPPPRPRKKIVPSQPGKVQTEQSDDSASQDVQTEPVQPSEDSLETVVAAEEPIETTQPDNDNRD
ncbi:MAG: hypothetical protein EPN30_05355 [Actinomycetota bacterium]|nr:MAG: hypothetical protein EPN30_05355 [Actinomycetota bacterium]